MRIAVIGPTYPFRGGIAHYTTLLVRALRAAGHQVDFVSFRRQYPHVLFPGRTDRDPSQAVLHEPCRYLIDPLRPWQWPAVAGQICSSRPQLVLLQWWVPFWSPLLAVLIRRIRRCSTARLAVIVHNLLPHDGDGPLDRLLMRFALREADVLCVHSRSELRTVGAWLPQLPVVTLRMPAFLALLTPAASPAQIAAVRHSLALPVQRTILLFFGLVRPYKGLLQLIEALADLPAGQSLHLLVVGEIWRDRRRIQALIRQRGLTAQVTLVDRYIRNEELPALFALADALVLPYRSATQSAVAALALAAGKPVVATRVGGLPELLHDGIDALLVEPENRPALTAALAQMADPTVRARLSAAAAQRAVEAAGDWPRLIAQLTALAGPADHG